MHSANSIFPGIDSNGGYAELLKTSDRAVIKLPATLAPKDVAPYADAGLTAYRAAKKASRHLLPGQFAVIIGAGGLGHIGIQALRALCAATIIVVDRSPVALELAKKVGADHTVAANSNGVEEVWALTYGKGAEAVIDFVGEGDSVSTGIAMTRNAGYYYVVGYGGELRIPTMDLITPEKTIVGNLVGTYPELVELMELADRGRVELATQEYRLDHANQALQDLRAAKVRGRAVLVP
jgi:NAD+-dependent secondary alcohol dehydrogenase Adh1